MYVHVPTKGVLNVVLKHKVHCNSIDTDQRLDIENIIFILYPLVTKMFFIKQNWCQGFVIQKALPAREAQVLLSWSYFLDENRLPIYRVQNSN